MQYFTTFFLAFYSGHCYERYEQLYPACMDTLNGVLLFVFEMTTSLQHKDIWNHRLQALKYLLACTWLFFMGVTSGGALTEREWNEVVSKGLLTRSEVELLRRYPGPEISPILSTWAMYVIDDALGHDIMWGPKCSPVAHIHNRLDKSLMKMMQSCRLIASTIAMPIPFAYWHLLNLVFAFNFLMLAFLFAGFQSFMTILPFCMLLLVTMSLREVSIVLADPFGEDSVDFPVGKFLEYVFDHSVCLLQAFSNPAAYEWVEKALHETNSFSEAQIRRGVEKEVMYNEKYQPHRDSPHLWSKDMPIKGILDAQHVKDLLTDSLAFLKVPSQVYDGDDIHNEEMRRLESELKAATAEVTALRAQQHAKSAAETGTEHVKSIPSSSMGAEVNSGIRADVSSASSAVRGRFGDTRLWGLATQQEHGGFVARSLPIENFDEARLRIKSMLERTKSNVSSTGHDAKLDVIREEECIDDTLPGQRRRHHSRSADVDIQSGADDFDESNGEWRCLESIRRGGEVNGGEIRGGEGARRQGGPTGSLAAGGGQSIEHDGVGHLGGVLEAEENGFYATV
eukprot:TRINITY_DN68210_c0_g1_i1.p1 TRINITY_DN68210_c0_g1~~TRINITY_DN68210_c0_g1_i1.p1  ORF type:complete len:653 (+),score=92.30 TRINITY_DN68210_c0_g1_i1:261-1961(+)